MRVCLLLNNPKDFRNGYLNLDPFSDGTDERVQCDVSNLDPQVCDNEAVEIVAHDILPFFPYGRCDELIQHWLKKLRHGGELTVSCLDLREIARGVLNETLTIDTANALLYGPQSPEWALVKNASTLQRLSDVFESKGYKVVQKKVWNFRSVVTARRD